MAGKEYQMAFSIGAKLQGQFGSAFKSAQTSVASLQNAITSLNKQQGDIAAYQKQQKAVEQTKAKLSTLQQQYANLKAAMGENGEASVELKNKMLAKELQIERTTQRLETQEAQLQSTGNALNQAGVDTQNLTAASQSLETEIESLKNQQEELAASTEETGSSMTSAADSMMELVSALGVTEVLKAGYNAMKACAEEAIAFEASMAAVKRTVGGDDAFLSGLAASFKQLSTEIPITTSELTEIATTAGQLGIAQNDVESFTTVMAKLATTTDLTAADAATMLAQFSNITGVKDYDRLGSVIAELGDATATTASKVVEMSQGMAASASQAGMTSTDIMAISASLGSLGIEAQAGATSMSQLISTLYKATETGEKLQDFASVAGMSAEQFKQAWADNAVSAMNAFIQGLNDVERNGKSAIVILDELGINNVRQTKAILGLASAGNLLSNTVNQATNAWSQNTALTEKAQVMYETTQAKLTMLNSAFSNMKIAIGDAFTPVISGAAQALTGILQPVTSFIEQNPALIRAITAAAAVIGAVTVALTAYTAVAKIATTASKALTAAIPGAKLIMGVTAAIAGLVAIVTLLSDAFGSGQMSMAELDAEFDGLNEQIQEQDNIIDLCNRYRKLQKELHGTADSIEDLDGLSDVDIELTASAVADIVPEDFMVEGAEGITLTAEQIADLVEAGFMKPDDPGVEISAGQLAELLESGFLAPNDPGITLTAEQVAELQSKGFLKPDDPGIELTAKQFAELYEKGFLKPDDPGITLTAEQKAELIEAGFLKADDPGITLTAEQTAELYASGFLKDDDTGIVLTAEQTASLLAEGFLDPTDKGIELTAEQTAALVASGFLDPNDKGIILTAAQTASLLASGFLNPGDQGITLTAEQMATLKAAGFLTDDTANINGKPTKDLKAQDFVEDPNLALYATIDNLPELQSAVQRLAEKATKAKEELTTAQTDLATMQERYEQLEARLKHAGNASDKSAIQTEMEALSGVISQQEEKVGKLEAAYREIGAEYALTSTAANELSAKEAELTAIKEQLVDASAGVIAANGKETASLEEQIDTLEALAQAKKTELQAKLYTNITAQAEKYGEALRQNNEATAAMSPLLHQAQVAQKWLGMNADQVNETYQQMLANLDAMEGKEGFDPSDKNYLAAIDDLQVMTDMMGSFLTLSELAGQGINWAETFGYIGASENDWKTAVEEMNAAISEYSEEVSDAASNQQILIDNLVNGINSGVLGLDELESYLLTTFSTTEDGGEIVADIMAKVRAELESAAEAAEEMGEGFEDTAASASDVNTAIAPIITKMEELGKAYQEAYDSAYESMSGQFDLFEKAPELTKTSVDDMIAALQSQQQYMAEYSANLKAAAEMGLSDGLIAQLSDGSKESAAYLQSIVQDGANKIDELNVAFAGVEAGKEEFAGTVAEMETDFAAKMAELQAQLEATIAEMDLSSEAAASGSATVKAFADAAAGLAPTVSAAFKKVADAAKKSLTLRVGVKGGEVQAYATGTQEAEKGFAVVGENGPELVYFNGGEKVLNASETEAVAEKRSLEAEPVSAVSAAGGTNGNTYHIELSPEYHIGGSMDSDELRSVMDEQNANLRLMIEEVLEEIESDRERSVYA